MDQAGMSPLGPPTIPSSPSSRPPQTRPPTFVVLEMHARTISNSSVLRTRATNTGWRIVPEDASDVQRQNGSSALRGIRRQDKPGLSAVECERVVVFLTDEGVVGDRRPLPVVRRGLGPFASV